MRKLLVASAMVLVLAGCGGRRVGLGKTGPDEFAVARNAPLVVPPDFALTPPKPGQARVQEGDSSRQALDAMFGGATPRSDTETAALDAAGNDRAQAGIRSAVGDPGTAVVDKGAVTRDIVAAPEGDGQDARATIPTEQAANAVPAADVSGLGQTKKKGKKK
jgi:hypothetical protein